LCFRQSADGKARKEKKKSDSRFHVLNFLKNAACLSRLFATGRPSMICRRHACHYSQKATTVSSVVKRLKEWERSETKKAAKG
jgi:hypothetical protein